MFKLYHIYGKLERVMINSEFVFDDIKDMCAWWVPDAEFDASDLAGVVNVLLDSGVSLLSVPLGANSEIWPWIENKDINIVNRFIFDSKSGADVVDSVSKLTALINGAFKSGAVGVQVFVHVKDISQFCDAIKMVRQDLFFDKSFSIAIDINEMRNIGWGAFFDSVRCVRPDAFLITVQGDSFDANSDFPGLVFDMLNNWNLNSDLHLWFGKNMFRVSQVLRLCQKIKPDLVQNMRVFTNVVSRASE